MRVPRIPGCGLCRADTTSGRDARLGLRAADADLRALRAYRLADLPASGGMGRGRFGESRDGAVHQPAEFRGHHTCVYMLQKVCGA